MFCADRNCQQTHSKGQKCSHWQYQQFLPTLSGRGLLKMETLQEVSSASSVIKQLLERAQHWFDYWFNVFRRGSLLAREALCREQRAMRTGQGTQKVAKGWNSYWFALSNTTTTGNRSWQLLKSEGRVFFMPQLSLTVLSILIKKCFWFLKACVTPSKMESLRRWRSVNMMW